jgi:opacity protein-like surface antigen
MSSGTPELYMSFMSGIAMTRSADAIFTDGSGATRTPPVSDVVNDVDYRNNFALGGNAGVWFPTRNKLAGFDLGVELTGFLWQADVAFGRNNFNQDPATGAGTTTEMQALYIGPNFLVRYPIAISEAYPNGRWFPYVGIGVGMHQMSMRPGGTLGISACCVPGGNLNTNPIPDQRDTTVGWLAMAGVKAHLFKYVAAFVEAKYVQAHHKGLLTDRFGQSAFTFPSPPEGSTLVLNQYSSNINSIHVHVGLSIHFDIRP